MKAFVTVAHVPLMGHFILALTVHIQLLLLKAKFTLQNPTRNNIFYINLHTYF